MDGGDAKTVLDAFKSEGVDVDALATRLQREGAESFTASWQVLLAGINAKRVSLTGTGA